MKFVDRLISFWLSFGVAYFIMRWPFHAGHLSAALAYMDAAVVTGFAALERKRR